MHQHAFESCNGPDALEPYLRRVADRSVDELRDCFIRVLNDWGLWNSSLDYGRYWDAAFAGFLQALSIVLPQAVSAHIAAGTGARRSPWTEV